ncbi:MAG: hypothetical protein Q9227_005548 [Pyrenula ochraceoflavens]
MAAAPNPSLNRLQGSTNPLPSPNSQSQFPGASSNNPSPAPAGGLRFPSNRKTIYDRNLNRSRNSELSHAAFAYLFMEMVVYAQKRVTGIQDLERRLNAQAHPLGVRLLDLILYRSIPTTTTGSSAPTPRPTRVIPLLQLIIGRVWPLLFTRAASSLEQSTTNPAEYMIIDNEPLVNKFVSVPREMSQLNCAAWVAGLVEGVCDAAGLSAECSAHSLETGKEGAAPGRTVILVKFSEATMEREKELERMGIKG